MTGKLDALIAEVRGCTLCADQLVHGVRPVVQLGASARVLIAGQAPGSRVHETGVPFDDPSGERLRGWMGVDREAFYDPEQIAILPMGFCYPGSVTPGRGRSGDKPPLAICARTWRRRLLDALPDIELTLVIGQYAQAWHLERAGENLTETVRAWSAYGEETLPLPHPSPRNNIWLKRNPWFEDELLPVLKQRIRRALGAR